jgi:hypothetical protein
MKSTLLSLLFFAFIASVFSVPSECSKAALVLEVADDLETQTLGSDGFFGKNSCDPKDTCGNTKTILKQSCSLWVWKNFILQLETTFKLETRWKTTLATRMQI